jgi:hypothetical protein
VPISEPIATAQGLRAGARAAARRAGEARRLAIDIEARRGRIGGRIEMALALHRSEVWDSLAATRSRDELQRGVALMISAAMEGARRTRSALEREAADLDVAAAGYRLQAEALEADAAAVAAEVLVNRPGGGFVK